jgi:hypothetical protein
MRGREFAAIQGKSQHESATDDATDGKGIVHDPDPHYRYPPVREKLSEAIVWPRSQVASLKGRQMGELWTSAIELYPLRLAQSMLRW